MTAEWFYIQRWNKARKLKEREEERKKKQDKKSQGAVVE